VHSPLLHLADATFVETSKLSSRQIAAKHFLVIGALLNLADEYVATIDDASELGRLRARDNSVGLRNGPMHSSQFATKSRSLRNTQGKGVLKRLGGNHRDAIR
jgi:hypothetical protein